ncbi:polysaccharide pyruvyl transferase family protein [Prevotella sp. LCP21S3_D2]|uniref:polysaccharide pyruvyl transferase family protein n=1 Tax=Prevotella sp. LCP21S3_D2 TaxID=3438800 RepID=UPI003F9A1E08
MQTNLLINHLREKIQKELTPIVDNDYVYLDLPYHHNIGDTLIWEGTREFLKTVPYKCLYYASKDSFRYRKLPKNVIILLHGGGNFGDLYRLHSEFRKKIIKLYPDNKVVILPQTVFYEDMSLLQSDVDFYAAHPNVTICAREQVSFNFLTENFKNQVLLLPDMAFYLDLKKYKVFEDENRVLYLKRTDKELVNANMVKIPANSEQHDWPTYENHYGEFDMVERFTHLLRIIFKICGLRDRILARLEDWKRNWYYRRKYVQMGVSFLSPYHTIYTTRLHVLILGVLLAKKIYLINNTSGKVVNFYNTWLNELDSIKKL